MNPLAMALSTPAYPHFVLVGKHAFAAFNFDSPGLCLTNATAAFCVRPIRIFVIFNYPFRMVVKRAGMPPD